MRGENGVAVKKSSTKKTIEDVKSINKNNNKKSLDNKKVSRTIRKKVKCELTSENIDLFHEGKHYESYGFMGAHCVSEKRKKGVRFTTWAPRAKRMYVVGDFSDFKIKDEYEMEKVSDKGIWSIFIEGLNEGEKYKYAIENIYGHYNLKSDPYAFKSENRPNTASIVGETDKYKWNDKSWMLKRKRFNMYESPINIYEMHLGSWKTKDEKFLTYREIAEQLPNYLVDMGYTHVEILPIIEHPLDASWGYQGVGYYSVTSRYGNANDFKYLIDELHNAGIGVILDWVPSHFCKDSHGLYMFDGTPTYEYDEEWKRENKGWGTCNFDLGKPEVKSFLISNLFFWIREFHIDGIRNDAVSNMLYLSYGRENDEWHPNIYGENGNLEAIQFIKDYNSAIHEEFPTVMTIAEESTAWAKISKPVEEDGLGFNFKWNMGWMNEMTFSMAYHYSENFILSISHDEVVHGKGALVNKMWGDYWNKFAGLRLYLTHMIGHPGKKLIFMGSEFGQFEEWNEDKQLQWNLIEEFEMHKKTQLFFKDMNHYYKEHKALWENDYNLEGYKWIDPDNSEESIYSFIRMDKKNKESLIFVCNYTPVVRYDFRLGVPELGKYVQDFNTDSEIYGGSGQTIDEVLIAEEVTFNNQPYSITIKVPPMAAIILKKMNNNSK